MGVEPNCLIMINQEKFNKYMEIIKDCQEGGADFHLFIDDLKFLEFVDNLLVLEPTISLSKNKYYYELYKNFIIKIK